MAHINADDLLDIEWKPSYGEGMFGQQAFAQFTLGRKMKHRSFTNGRIVEYTKQYKVFGWTEDGKGRIVTGGDEVAGPYATLLEEPVMITATPIQRPTVVAYFEIGDTITIKGTTYAITEVPVFRDLKLVPVQA